MPRCSEEAVVRAEDAEGVSAVENRVCLVMDLTTGAEQLKRWRNSDAILRVEVDRIGSDEKQLVDAEAKLSWKVHETKWLRLRRGRRLLKGLDIAIAIHIVATTTESVVWPVLGSGVQNFRDECAWLNEGR